MYVILPCKSIYIFKIDEVFSPYTPYKTRHIIESSYPILYTPSESAKNAL